MACVLGACALLAATIPSAAVAQPESSYDFNTSYEVVVSAGKSQVIQLPSPYTDVMVADPKIADVLPLNTRAIYVVGKSMGATALTIYGPGKRLIAAINVVVSADIESFKGRLHDILPAEKDVAVRAANQSIVLSGTVSSPVVLDQILRLANTYAPDKVVNMMTVEGTQQVMLSVRFVEMERTTAKNLGFSSTFSPAAGNSPTIAFATGAFSALNPPTTVQAFGFLSSVFHAGDGDLSLFIDALETKGLVKTLAEPNLVAMSGDTANFLAGGEFPYPVPQASSGTTTTGTSAITIEFKQFGVALAFTPTILKDGLINLVVNPEVSSLDFANAVQIGSGSVPGLKVRRARTTVELRDGESFTIAGLLKEDYANQVRQYPFLGDLPIIGTLLRSTNYQRNETELVIVVTPHLVVPRRGPVASPADRFIPPSDFELFVFGSQDAATTGGIKPADRALMSSDPNKGGIDGPHGHVLY
ncbi:MAG TPA: type II and III secretion system protein family protein [Caulobacteraceae bacterium]|nr:type II and III secretion system protein family protein [Caulobacteraceae bacterium]